MVYFGKRGIGFILILAAALAGRARAEAAPPHALDGQTVFVVDSADDRVIALVDRDGSGAVEPAAEGEMVVFYDDTSPGPDLSVPSAIVSAPGGRRLYLLDGGTLDAVFVLEDRDWNGDANGEGEWGVFYDDSSPGPNLSTPGALALGTDGALYVADDGSGAKRILRLEDKDGDGSANGGEEWKVVFDLKAQVAGGEVPNDIESIAFSSTGDLLAGDSTLGRIYRMKDLTGDGDYLDPDEVRIYYDPRGSHPFGKLTGLAADSFGAVYAADAGTGLVVRLRDANDNGDALDAGEATIFLDPASPPALQRVAELTVTNGGALLLADTQTDSIHVAIDLDADGRALGEGEAVRWTMDAGRFFDTPAAMAVVPVSEPPDLYISRIEPSEGPAGGGTTVRISGRFPEGKEPHVAFAGALAEVFTVTANAIECRTPPGPEGLAEVRIRAGTSETARPAGFRYHGRLFLRGDGNEDSVVDLSDAVAIVAHLFLGGPLPSCRDAMDANDDGALNITDPVFLLDYLFLGGDRLPAPFPEPGPDGTGDSLACEGLAG